MAQSEETHQHRYDIKPPARGSGWARPLDFLAITAIGDAVRSKQME